MKVKAWKKKFCLLACALLVSFVGAELAVRVYYGERDVGVDENELCLKQMKKNLPSDKSRNFVNFTRTGYWADDPYIGITLKKTYSRKLSIQAEKDVRYLMFLEDQHNSAGMNNIEEFSWKKPQNVSVRIALLGDSFTCGGQAPYLFGMANMLKELVAGSEVLNFCVGGRGIETMYMRYVLEARNYSPDVVFFNVFVDDLVRPFGCPLLTPNLTVVDGRLVHGPRQYPSLKDFYDGYQPPIVESYFLKHAAFVYNARTGYARDLYKGLEMFGVMLDDVKEKASADGTEFFVTLIQGPTPSPVSADVYQRLLSLLKQKDVRFLDGEAYLNKHRQLYRNQSFYYIREGNPLGHYSVIGYALHAQGMKNLLEDNGVISRTHDYYFVNFNPDDYMMLIPQDFSKTRTGTELMYPYIVQRAKSG
ncbi:SGNH/GDSL hydrolase family protein [Candidatus Woesearchaeota archaeon]|nr:SGNH/GDSL hydrolase family protein [Candidatus Woesearchaeota archaeon]